MKEGDIVYVTDWGKRYSDMTKWDYDTNQRENIFPMKTKLPDYCDIMFHSKHKNYRWEIIEIFKHPNTEKEIMLLASIHTDIDILRCYTIIGEGGVSTLTPKQVTDNNFNALIEANLGKWDRNNLGDRDKIPKEIKSVFYDEDDNVLFGSTMTKGLVSYHYLDGKYSTDGKPIYLGSSVLYDGYGNKKCPNKNLIKSFEYIKNTIE